MLSPYCLKCRINIESKKPRISKNGNENIMHLSKCPMNNSKKTKIIKELEAIGLLSQLGIRTPLRIEI